MSAPPKRRRRLVKQGGVEMFEARVVHWFDTDGKPITSVEVSAPEGHDNPDIHEVLGALDMAKRVAFEMYKEAL